MNEQIAEALRSLSTIQREAVVWNDGAALVLAGPGAGKTRVLTTRIARLLDETPEKRFRILALTFTTKAAEEMRERVARLVPRAVDERTFIGTFHAFCTQLLRQHGSHIGIRPDFAIIDRKEERRDILVGALDAARAAGKPRSPEDVALLDTIDHLKSKLVSPERAVTRGEDGRVTEVYALYEEAIRAENAVDFNGLILESCRLLAKVPPIAKGIRQTYPFWMVDEFQDTSPAQYWLLRYLSGDEFKNLMAVADDDQIIYQWAGASYRQIERFRSDYKPELIQLVENHRCPPEVVDIANRLVAHNTQRTPGKRPITAGRTEPVGCISYGLYESDEEERQGICDEIQKLGPGNFGKIAIIGRTRALLEPTLSALRVAGVKAVLVQRRDNFVSPQFVWLLACLEQALRPNNKRVFTVLANAANRFAGLELESDVLISEAEAAGHSYFEHWAIRAEESKNPLARQLGSLVRRLAHSRVDWSKIVGEAIPLLLATAPVAEGAVSDVSEDEAAWRACLREIRSEIGRAVDLADLVQGMALRSKEPPRDASSVTLLTVHGAKGLEFDYVFVMGLAEEEMPSWQSCKKGDASPEMEEERRNCFVAVTRTQERLVISSAKRYRGRNRSRSRFLSEMNLV